MGVLDRFPSINLVEMPEWKDGAMSELVQHYRVTSQNIFKDIPNDSFFTIDKFTVADFTVFYNTSFN